MLKITPWFLENAPRDWGIFIDNKIDFKKILLERGSNTKQIVANIIY